MKKITILFLSFIALVVGVLSLPTAHAIGLEEQYPFDLTVVFGEDTISGRIKPEMGLFNYGESASLAIQTLNGTGAVGEKEFAFYVIDNEIITDANHQFLVTSKTKV